MEDYMSKELERRIANISKQFCTLSEIMKDKDTAYERKNKLYIFKYALCRAYYRCQAWALKEQLENKEKVCLNGMERNVLGTKRRDRVKLQTTKIKRDLKMHPKPTYN